MCTISTNKNKKIGCPAAKLACRCCPIAILDCLVQADNPKCRTLHVFRGRNEFTRYKNYITDLKELLFGEGCELLCEFLLGFVVVPERKLGEESGWGGVQGIGWWSVQACQITHCLAQLLQAAVHLVQKGHAISLEISKGECSGL
jgi:hypothetical protein